MYSCLNVHTHYSLLTSTIKSSDLVRTAKELDITSLAITDYGSISGAIDFIKSCEREKIKWIVGTKLLFKGTRIYTTILAKNYVGWKNLIKIISATNESGRIDQHGNPTIDFDLLDVINTEGLICIIEDGYNTIILPKYMDKFPELYFGLTLIPDISIDAQTANIRKTAKLHDKKVVALPSPHYLKQGDYKDHHVLLASKLKTTTRELYTLCDTRFTEYKKFLDSDQFYLPSKDDLLSRGYELEELENANTIAESCEQYNVFSKAKMPNFDVPEGHDANSYLRKLCNDGFCDILKGAKPSEVAKYADRYGVEMKIIEEANLAPYFLIVADYVNWLRQRSIVGAGRGSVGGSLVAYLIGITDVDPLPYNLLFSRFYNSARKGSMPDIDIDVPIHERENVIEYIRNKYGFDKTCQVCTFGRLQGRGVLKEVLRVHGVCGQLEMNRITEAIPDEAKIADELQEMKEALEAKGIFSDPSIIIWALENNAKDLKDWCYLTPDKKLEGPLSLFFEQAIRLEYTLKTQGKHAAALLISNDPIIETCPLIYDKHRDGQTAGFEYEFCEAIGLMKIDILGLACLDKLFAIQKLVNERYFKQELASV